MFETWDSDMATLAADIVDTVGDKVLEVWRQNLDDNIRVNNQRYVNQTRVTRRADMAVVHDDMSVYGPWLEGQGSRNFPVTRFKGYGSARSAADKVGAMVDEVAAPAVVSFVEAQNA